jgi:hypothetical protein
MGHLNTSTYQYLSIRHGILHTDSNVLYGYVLPQARTTPLDMVSILNNITTTTIPDSLKVAALNSLTVPTYKKH